METTYRDVLSFPGYRVGSDGSVWSCWKQVGVKGRVGKASIMSEEWHQLAPLNGQHGYPCVRIKQGVKIKHMRIHRLVLDSFVGPRPLKMLCRHLDGNPANNALENLCWGTYQQNAEDAMRHGRVPKGEAHHNAILTEDGVRAIRARAANGETVEEIAASLNMAAWSIGDVVQKINWAHVT